MFCTFKSRYILDHSSQACSYSTPSYTFSPHSCFSAHYVLAHFLSSLVLVQISSCFINHLASLYSDLCSAHTTFAPFIPSLFTFYHLDLPAPPNAQPYLDGICSRQLFPFRSSIDLLLKLTCSPLRGEFVTSAENVRDSGQSSTNTSNTQQHSQQLSSRVAGIIHFNS